MWKFGPPCGCCGGCVYFFDDFQRAEVGRNWEVKGDVAISGGQLLLRETGATAVCQVENTRGAAQTGYAIATPSVAGWGWWGTSPKGIGNQVAVLFDYIAADDCFAWVLEAASDIFGKEMLIHRWELREPGQQPRTLHRFSSDPNAVEVVWPVWCEDTTGVTFIYRVLGWLGWRYDRPPRTSRVAVTADRIATGTEAAVSMIGLERHRDQVATCMACPAGGLCSNGFPAQWRVLLSGLRWNGQPAPQLDGEYVAKKHYGTVWPVFLWESARWVSVLDEVTPGLWERADWGVRLYCTPEPPQITVEAGYYDYYIGTGIVVWKTVYTFGQAWEAPVDCWLLSEEELPKLSGDGDARCYVSAIS